jgi:hypothetical protein
MAAGEPTPGEAAAAARDAGTDLRIKSVTRPPEEAP